MVENVTNIFKIRPAVRAQVNMKNSYRRSPCTDWEITLPSSFGLFITDWGLSCEVQVLAGKGLVKLGKDRYGVFICSTANHPCRVEVCSSNTTVD